MLINFIKRNKIFSFIILITIFTFIGGIIIHSLLDISTKGEIVNNLYNYSNNINIKNIFDDLFSNILLFIIIWLFGISVVGIPIIIFLYLFKVLISSLEIVFLILNIKTVGVIFSLISIVFILLNLILLFLLFYYACNYSVCLIKVLFLKYNYNIKLITKRFIKILLFCFIGIIVVYLLKYIVFIKILVLLK